MTIQVTAEDISNGKPHRTSWCPVALAFRRATGGISSVSVNLKSARQFDSHHKGWDLPPEATNFIKRFDAGLPVEPFEFEVK